MLEETMLEGTELLGDVEGRIELGSELLSRLDDGVIDKRATEDGTEQLGDVDDGLELLGIVVVGLGLWLCKVKKYCITTLPLYDAYAEPMPLPKPYVE